MLPLKTYHLPKKSQIMNAQLTITGKLAILNIEFAYLKMQYMLLSKWKFIFVQLSDKWGNKSCFLLSSLRDRKEG